jgi:tetratricopeptide (TPR) repeat protein
LAIPRNYLLLALCLSITGASANAATTGMSKTKAPQTVAKITPKPLQSGFSETKIFRGKITNEDSQGEKLLLAGKYAEAQNVFHQALNTNSKDLAALSGMGFALALQFKLDAADQQFTKALTIDPKYSLAHVGKAFSTVNRLQSSNMTILKQRKQLLAAAESECKQALSIEPNMPEGLLVLGMVQKEQGKLDAAMASFSKSIEADPKYASAFVNRGLIDLQRNDTQNAIEDFKQAISLRSSNAAAHYGLGMAYSQTGQLDQAYKELNTALSLNTNSAPAHTAMGDVYGMQGNLNAAIKEYKAAVAIKAENTDAYLKLADIYQGRGDLEIAASQLRSGLEMNPNSTPLQLRLADLSLQMEKLDDALKGYSSVLQANPSSVAAANGMTTALVLKAQKEASGAYFVSNNFEGAEQLLQRAIQMNPNNMELRLAEMKLRVMAGQPADLASIGTPTTDPQRIAYAEASLAQYKFGDATQNMNTVIANAQTAKATFAIADMALMTRDLDSATSAYQKAETFGGPETLSRARRGESAVDKARSNAKQQLTLAKDLSSKKQWASAIDNYRNAQYLNPRLADAHLGLAESLQKFEKKDSSALREAALHYKAFVALTPTMPEKEQTKYAEKANKCMEIAYKIDSGHPPSRLSAVFGPVSNLGKKIGNGVKNALE